MSETVVTLQPALILQHRPYRETSLILDLFTRDYGIVGVIAKGVRQKKSKTAGLLQLFKALIVSFSGQSDLKTLTYVEPQADQIHLDGLALYCGFYVNELVGRFLHKHDPHPNVYDDYLVCLTQLIQPPPIGFTPAMQLEVALRLFEINLMQHVGLALLTAHDAQTEAPINPAAQYYVHAELGVVERVDGAVSGKTIQAIRDKCFGDVQALMEAKQVMRYVINFHLQGRPLKSRDILSKIFSKL